MALISDWKEAPPYDESVATFFPSHYGGLNLENIISFFTYRADFINTVCFRQGLMRTLGLKNDLIDGGINVIYLK